jgi:hypothetical protein
MIEANDHPAPNIDAGVLDAVNALEQRAGIRPYVLQLLRFF